MTDPVTLPQKLDLFPLSTVLFPGMPLPLRIFEPRYHRMMAACLEDEQIFGVCLIKEGTEVGPPAIPHSIGTAARILEHRSLPDGQLVLVGQGVARFRIQRLVQEQPFIKAEVTPYPLMGGAPRPDEQRLREQFAALRDTLRRLTRTEARAGEELPAEVPAGLLPFVAAGSLALPVAIQQQLLDLADRGELVSALLPHLESRLALLDEALRRRQPPSAQ